MVNYFKIMEHTIKCALTSIAWVFVLVAVNIFKVWFNAGRPLNVVYFALFGVAILFVMFCLYPMLRHRWYKTQGELDKEYKRVRNLGKWKHVLWIICACSVYLSAYGYQRNIITYDEVQANLALRDSMNVSAVSISIMQAMPAYMYDTLAYNNLRNFKNDALTYQEAADLENEIEKSQLIIVIGAILAGVTHYILFRQSCYHKNLKLIAEVDKE